LLKFPAAIIIVVIIENLRKASKDSGHNCEDVLLSISYHDVRLY